VDLYLDAAYPSGTYLTSAIADAQREAGVGAACATASSAHGFFIPLAPSTRKTHAGRKVYVHAIDEHGNQLLHSSGVFAIH
jgi:hypothetical protein